MVADAGTTARDALDRVEAQLEPGRGRVDLFSFVRGSSTGGAVAGAGVDLQHRLGLRGALFTHGWIGAAWDPLGSRELAGEVLGGLRWRW